MKINYVSTLSLNSSLRASTLNKQSELADVQKEVATGRKADIGRDLGAFTSSAVSVESEIELIKQIKVTNSFVENRLQTMQSGIDQLVANGNDFMGQLTAEINSALDRSLLETLGNTAFGSLQATVNVSIKGEYVFSGVNTDSRAMVDYQAADGAPAKAAVQAAFSAHFGFAVNDPAAETITPAAMETFLDGPFADLFNDANWGTLWSGSSEFGTRSKISTRELVETPVTANATAFRDAASASVMIAEFSDTAITEETMTALATKAFEQMANAVSQLGDEQSRLGVVEERVKTATERMDFQKTILTNQLSGLVDVDPYEAATRLTNLTTSLEASYAVTARIQSLSLLNFI
ncbi:MAG: flagellar hook-associated family protein [Rhizobiaceae bacterium]|jgi:flagellar hook-associated protein 3 FlgL|nr:flagellar hook-associated family protein [Rhizobiaceae bacterium]